MESYVPVILPTDKSREVTRTVQNNTPNQRLPFTICLPLSLRKKKKKSADHKNKWSLAPGRRKKGREEISTQILSESRRGPRARPPPSETSGSGGTGPPARPGPTAPPRRSGAARKKSLKPLPPLPGAAARREPPFAGAPRGGAAPSPSPHGPVPSAHGSGPPRPSVRPPQPPGLAPGGGLRPAPSQRSLGALVVRAARLPPHLHLLLLLASPSLLPSPARPSARTHPPSSSLPGPRCVCAALPHAARRRPGGWVCGEGG